MNDYQFWINAAILILTIVAIIYGPIWAIKVNRKLDEERDARSRKYAILSDLMRTRQARIDPVHVAALNLIELDFYGQKDVVVAYRDYVNPSYSPNPARVASVGGFEAVGVLYPGL